MSTVNNFPAVSTTGLRDLTIIILTQVFVVLLLKYQSEQYAESPTLDDWKRNMCKWFWANRTKQMKEKKMPLKLSSSNAIFMRPFYYYKIMVMTNMALTRNLWG